MDENIREERVEELENAQPAEEAVQQPVEAEAEQPVAEPEAAPVEAVAEEAPVAAEAAPKQGFAGVKNLVQSFIQKVGKKAAIAIAAAVGVVVIGGVAAAAAAGGSPVGNVFKGAQKTAESVGDVELVSVLDEILNGGSIEVSLNTEGVSEGLLDMDVVAKLYLDLKESKLAFYANAAMDGSDLADATVWVDEKDIVVASENLLDENYGISLKKLEENLTDSAILDIIGIDPEDLEEMMQMSSEAQIDEKTVKALEEDATKLLEKVIKQFSKSVTEYAEIEKGKKEVNFNGEKVKAKTVDVKIDGDQLAEVIYEVAEFLYESKDMEALLEDYTDLMTTYLAATGEEIDAEDIIDEVYEALDEILDNIDDISDEMEDIEFNVVAYLNSGCLIGMDFAMEEDSEEVAVSVMAGPTLADMKEFRVTIEEYGDKTTLVYAVDANDSKEYNASLKVREDGKVVTSASITWDKKAGDYKCKMEQLSYDWWDDEEYMEEYTVSGSLLAEKDCYNLEIKKVGYDGEEIKPGISICVDLSDKQPSKPKYVEVLTMDEEELLELGEDIMDEVKDLTKMFR